MSDRLKAARERAGFESAAEAARRFGWPEATYRHHENGTRNFPKHTAAKYARSLKVSQEWLLLGVGAPARATVEIVGSIGMGMQVDESNAGSLGAVDAPPGVDDGALALRVMGDNMYPRYMDGDVLIYSLPVALDVADGRECVVCLSDGRKFVKIVRAEGDNTATLESWSVPPMRSVSVAWVAIIHWVKRA